MRLLALRTGLLTWTLVCTLSRAAAAQPAAPDSVELARRLDALARRVADLELGPVAGPPESRYGLGPAASKVYGVASGVSIGGYGEALYQNVAAENEAGAASNGRDTIDYLRQIIYLGYKFDERLLFNSEIEFEHAATAHHGTVAVEFAYLDAMLHRAANLRAGMLLVPIGFVNELHEPPVFLGARRPEVERRIIPTTWRANGAGLFGEPVNGMSYRAYLIESLRAIGDSDDGVSGFNAGGLRGGRQSGSEALFEDLAGVARVDWTANGLGAGAAVFVGNTGQSEAVGNDVIGGLTTIFEAHAQVHRAGLRLRALVSGATVDDAAAINTANGLTGNGSMGSELGGWYVEGGYELWSRLRPQSRFELVPYVRFEEVNTQVEVPDGFSSNPANDLRIITLGGAFYPHSQVVVKSDYEIRRNEADTGVDQWNIAIGYLF
jgi:hypothetical protein